jgi:hypothetical protein
LIAALERFVVGFLYGSAADNFYQLPKDSSNDTGIASVNSTGNAKNQEVAAMFNLCSSVHC